MKLLMIFAMLVSFNAWAYDPAEEEHKAQVEREWAEQNAREEAAAKKARENWAREEKNDEAAKKHKCGKDYKALRVGMTLARVEQCYEEPAYVTDTVDARGTVKTFRGTFYLIYVQNGIVTGYTKRTD